MRRSGLSALRISNVRWFLLCTMAFLSSCRGTPQYSPFRVTGSATLEVTEPSSERTESQSEHSPNSDGAIDGDESKE